MNPPNLQGMRSKKMYIIAAVVLFFVVGFVFVLVRKNLPKTPLDKVFQQKPQVAIKTEYKNPFEKNTQYVNPFEEAKNPFVTNR